MAAKKKPVKRKPKTVKKPYEPSEAERLVVAAERLKHEQTAPAPKFKVASKDGNDLSIEPDHPDPSGYWQSSMQRAFGSNDNDFLRIQSQLLCNALGSKGDNVKAGVDLTNAAMAAMQGIAPRDEVETLLATQMVAVQHAAMGMAKILMAAASIDQQNSAVNAMTKLNRTYVAQMDALNKHRGKGQQKVTVEHVHVHDGGQAIVGAIEGGRGQ
jgi:hypothetical protein